MPATRKRIPRETFAAKVTIRIPPQTRLLFDHMAAVHGFTGGLADVARHYMALGLRSDGIDPADVGLIANP
jgi:hypothetical protein